MDAAGVASSFRMVGAVDSLNVAGFHRWATLMFEDFTDQEYEVCLIANHCFAVEYFYV